jgi:hypothetical protein
MRLFQIPFSHNCVKVRHVLDLKGIPYETVNINPLWRLDDARVRSVLVPALSTIGAIGIHGDPAALRSAIPARLPADRASAERLLLRMGRRGSWRTRRVATTVLEGPPEDLGGLSSGQFAACAPSPARRGGRPARQVRDHRQPLSQGRRRGTARRGDRRRAHRRGRPPGRRPAEPCRHHARDDVVTAPVCDRGRHA